MVGNFITLRRWGGAARRRCGFYRACCALVVAAPSSPVATPRHRIRHFPPQTSFSPLCTSHTLPTASVINPNDKFLVCILACSDSVLFQRLARNCVTPTKADIFSPVSHSTIGRVRVPIGSRSPAINWRSRLAHALQRTRSSHSRPYLSSHWRSVFSLAGLPPHRSKSGSSSESQLPTC